MPEQQRETDRELEEVLSSHRTKICIVGTGGGGNNTVTRLVEVGIKEVRIIAVNTDAQDLLFAKADKKILIGKSITNGLGAGSDPVRGADSAKENIKEIEEALAGSDMVFVTCGLGGGTGTGSAPIIADLSKNSGALTIAIVTLPFSDEGVVRWENARKGLEQLQEKVDTVIVVQNDRLLDLVPDMALNAAFKVADEILVNAVKGITELVTEKGLVNLDFADVRTIMENGGIAMIGIGESENETDAETAAQKALENPLLDVDVTGAKNALINITGGQEMSLKSAKTVMKIIAKRLDPTARIIWGARLDEAMGQALRVMLIVTRLKSSRKSASDIEMVLKQTEVNHEIPKPANTLTTVVTQPAKSEKSGNKIFSEIFVEESQIDISTMEKAVKALEIGNRSENERQLRKIKSAITSLYNSSELFGFTKISVFAESISELTEHGLNADFDLSESLIKLYKTVPSVLEDMIAGDTEAYQKAEEIKKKF
ncbi:MAG: cell division protein FtsZ, partial [bacterium]